MTSSLRSIPFALTLAWAWATPAAFASEPEPQGLVSLSATAQKEVAKDVLSVTLSTTRDGADAASVQTAVKKALDAALAEARQAAKPGQIEVQTGDFSLSPRYNPKGGLAGWQGTVELQLEGRDIAGITQLAGRIDTLTVARVGTSLSREQREKVEAELAAQAIASYRAKAADYARQFGYSGYTVRAVQVGSQNAVTYAPRMERMTLSKAYDVAAAPLPVELGNGSVSITVSGTVQMTK